LLHFVCDSTETTHKMCKIPSKIFLFTPRVPGLPSTSFVGLHPCWGAFKTFGFRWRRKR